MNQFNCHICFGITEEDFLCDTCDNYYCESCSYIYGLHYQFEGSRCYSCSDQPRNRKLLYSDVRDNKIDIILSKNKVKIWN